MEMTVRGAGTQTQNSDEFLRWTTLAGCTAFFCQLIAYNFVDIDLWHQMALIRESLAVGHLLKNDPFAYSPTLSPWIDHEWGAGAVAFFATRWLGPWTIILLKFLIAMGTGVICLRRAESKGGDFRVLAICAPLAIFLAHLGFFSAVRAQVYTFFFTALLILFWQLDQTGSRRWIFVWLLLFPLWVNLHAGFVVGIGLMFLYWLEQVLRGRRAGHHLPAANSSDITCLRGMLRGLSFSPRNHDSTVKREAVARRMETAEQTKNCTSTWTVSFGTNITRRYRANTKTCTRYNP